ncbi:type II toxin-antitoxin system VapC family toxin [uncultured Roseivirga sp.]|uniref:type II toxin-antitoxin system VapC family toxin n=1 Tax=uncultured Roseivirga sp. TaxID=543088 RepID=UPI0030D96ED9|tara:strand:- start:137597 stop:137974 length:378 start_codon:yes stop_codon:yes gene_type:complete
MVNYEDRVLVDTNVIIYILNGNRELAENVHGRYTFLSVISELELLSFPKITPKEEFVINSFISDMNVIGLNDDVKRETKRIRKLYGLKLPDSIIAATAVYLNCRLLTADQQFLRIPELDVISVIP